MAEYRLTPAAQRDLDEAFDYTVEQWGVAQATRYIRSIATACARLADAPAQGAPCDHIRPGYRFGVVGRHRIYYRLADYGIVVIRILHDRMDTRSRL